MSNVAVESFEDTPFHVADYMQVREHVLFNNDGRDVGIVNRANEMANIMSEGKVVFCCKRWWNIYATPLRPIHVCLNGNLGLYGVLSYVSGEKVYIPYEAIKYGVCSSEFPISNFDAQTEDLNHVGSAIKEFIENRGTDYHVYSEPKEITDNMVTLDIEEDDLTLTLGYNYYATENYACNNPFFLMEHHDWPDFTCSILIAHRRGKLPQSALTDGPFYKNEFDFLVTDR